MNTIKNSTTTGLTAVKSLKLNFKTVSILDDVALQNIKGGRIMDAEENSCGSGFCGKSCQQTTTIVVDTNIQ